MSDRDGYVAQETCFLNFDIISLTFRNDLGKDTVIPVVADPIDIFNGVDPPPDLDPDNSWKWILKFLILIVGLLVLAILVPIVIPIVKLLFNLMGKLFSLAWIVVCAPFKLIGKIFRHKRE